VSYVNPASGGTSGTYFEGLLKTMGIADQMKSKIVYRTQGSVAVEVARNRRGRRKRLTQEFLENQEHEP
jgi:hypothetical protein